MPIKPLVLAAGCTLALAAPSLAAAPTIAKSTPGGTLKAEAVAFNASNWESLYSAYTKTYKARCPFGRFADAQSKARQQVGTITTKVTGVKIAGNKASLAYQIFHGSKLVGLVKLSDPDLYAKVNGLWYDEYEPRHGC